MTMYLHLKPMLGWLMHICPVKHRQGFASSSNPVTTPTCGGLEGDQGQILLKKEVLLKSEDEYSERLSQPFIVLSLLSSVTHDHYRNTGLFVGLFAELV